ncbi:hypothetical protein [Syntrophotalea carbinolica]|uniref:hypothetical protein n=1 Tax=Syntrophotalea carbinolica TaxID=19 RepID=UPI0002F9A717|nr:hypothetical protein [Syntrophotalea carbinolica]
MGKPLPEAVANHRVAGFMISYGRFVYRHHGSDLILPKCIAYGIEMFAFKLWKKLPDYHAFR